MARAARVGTGLATAPGGMARAIVHTLHFTDRNRLSAAFERIVSDEHVESCVVETSELRIRFVTTPERASALIERIYLDRGLRLAQSHALGSAPEA